MIIFQTGFGPFGSHTINASWVAVNELHRSGGLGRHDAELVIKEIIVEYERVKEFVPELWQRYQPKVRSKLVNMKGDPGKVFFCEKNNKSTSQCLL